MAETPARNKTGTSGQAHAGAPHLDVVYWKRMRPNKVYPVVVTGMGRGGPGPISLRLIMAGAQVVPAEHSIDTVDGGDKATFYVTPLAQGVVRAPHLEVVQDGRKIQEIQLPCTVTTQRRALVWLLLALVIPWLILHYFVYAPIGYEAPIKGDGHEEYVANPAEQYIRKLPRDEGEAPAKKSDKEPAPAKKAAEPSPTARITHFVQNNTPQLDRLLDKDSSLLAFYKTDVQGFPERAYIQLLRAHHEMYARGHPPAFYVFVLFVFMALISFGWRQERRKKIAGRPLPV